MPPPRPPAPRPQPASHFLDHISPIFPPFFLVFCAFSPSRRGGSNQPQAGTQGQETVARAPKHRFAGPANSGCSERMGGLAAGPRHDAGDPRWHACVGVLLHHRRQDCARERPIVVRAAASLCHFPESLKGLLHSWAFGDVDAMPNGVMASLRSTDGGDSCAPRCARLCKCLTACFRRWQLGRAGEHGRHEEGERHLSDGRDRQLGGHRRLHTPRRHLRIRPRPPLRPL